MCRMKRFSSIKKKKRDLAPKVRAFQEYKSVEGGFRYLEDCVGSVNAMQGHLLRCRRRSCSEDASSHHHHTSQ